MVRRLFLSFLVLFSTSALAGGETCADLLPVRYGELKPDFIHSDTYDVLIQENLIKNQCQTPHCHMYAWAGELERTSGIDISNYYLDAMRLYNETLAAINKKTSKINLGAYSLQSRQSIRHYGVIPASAWIGRTDFTSLPYYNRLEQTLESFAIHSINKLNAETDAAEILKLGKTIEKELMDLLANMIGPFPDKFEYSGKSYSPRSFAVKYFPELYDPLVVVTMARGSPVKTIPSAIDSLTLKMNFDRGEALLRQVLDSGSPAHLSYRHKTQFIDDATGVMSIEGFAYPENAGAISDADMVKFGAWGGNHAVLVVGYELDPTTDTVRKWKIQNSWGKEKGDHGYFHMYHDYFRKFAWGFSFVQDKSIKLPKM